MIQELLYLEDENTERCFSNPPVILKENKRSPLLGRIASSKNPTLTLGLPHPKI